MTARRKIVIVDDSPICREVAAQALEDRGHEVIALASPVGLTRTIRTCAPDLVLVDVGMPEVRGDRLVRLTRSLGVRDVAIFLHSDRGVGELQRLTAECGANGYIVKGAEADAFVDSVERAIAARPSRSSSTP
ncbi:MAG: response regulator [Myxococcota bacterium]